MRTVRALTGGFGFTAEQPWLPGVAHVAAALATYFVFGARGCVTGLLLATVASFIVYLPVTALALNGGQAIAVDQPVPAFTIRAQLMLLGLWIVTAWVGAALGAIAG